MSQRLSRDGSTVTRWLQRYRQGVLEKLLEVKTSPGAIAKNQGEVLQSFVEKLQCPQGFSSYEEILDWQSST
ncbi:MAG: hypothetical protein QNJ51_17985 [Calothrix sp. MO_167.B12]|nr:hypothetical protein [Calothrix sp. MO_167.B12]